MQRMGGGSRKRYTRKQRAGGNDPSCGCDMQAGWPKFLTENIPLPSVGPSQPTQKGGASCGIPPIPNYYQGGGGCPCSGGVVPTPLVGGGQPTVYNSNPVPDACPFPGTGYCGFYARGGSFPNHEGGANYGEPMYLQARLRGGANPVSFSGSVQHNNGTERSFHGTFNNSVGKARKPRDPGTAPNPWMVFSGQVRSALKSAGKPAGAEAQQFASHLKSTLGDAAFELNDAEIIAEHAKWTPPAPKPRAVVAEAAKPKPKRVLSEEDKAKMMAGRKAALERRMAESTVMLAPPAPVRVAAAGNAGNNEPPPSPVYLESPALTLRPLPYKGKKYLWDPEGHGIWLSNPNGSPGAWAGKLAANKRSINTTAKNYTAKGGANYGEPMSLQARLRGGGCGCGLRRGGGYRPTKKNLAALKKWRKGQSIGFTQTASLKAKGLIPRTSRKHRGKKVVSAKYK